MGIPDGSRDDALESWLSDLTDGETSVRRLRKRLDAERDPEEGCCPTCHGTSALGHTGHVTRVPTA